MFSLFGSSFSLLIFFILHCTLYDDYYINIFGMFPIQRNLIIANNFNYNRCSNISVFFSNPKFSHFVRNIISNQRIQAMWINCYLKVETIQLTLGILAQEEQAYIVFHINTDSLVSDSNFLTTILDVVQRQTGNISSMYLIQTGYCDMRHRF